MSAEWRALFARYSDRFLLGSDTWIDERWIGYDAIFKEYRAWLAQLPADQARRIANGNAAQLFGRDEVDEKVPPLLSGRRGRPKKAAPVATTGGGGSTP